MLELGIHTQTDELFVYHLNYFPFPCTHAIINNKYVMVMPASMSLFSQSKAQQYIHLAYVSNNFITR
jgi:hypothetical protein